MGVTNAQRQLLTNHYKKVLISLLREIDKALKILIAFLFFSYKIFLKMVH